MSDLPPGITEHYRPQIDLKTQVKKNVRIVCGYNLTDMGNANRLIAYYGHKIRYCAKLKMWFIWDGIRWAPDTTKLIEHLAKKTVIRVHSEVEWLPVKDKAKRKELTAWAYKSEAQNHIREMIKSAESDRRIAIDPSEFNANKMLINCPNGTLDLEKREFREHRREDMLTMKTAVPFPPLLHESKLYFPTLFKALPPEEIIYIQRVLGLGLEPTTQNKEWLFVYGMPFALKSSVTQPIYKALGDYAAEFDISLLTKSRHGIASNAARPEIIALMDKRIIWTEEAPADFIIDESRLKNFTSSGTKTLRQLFGTSEEIQLVCTIVVESNGTYTLNVEDEWTRDAMQERTRVAKFVHPIPEKDRDADVLKHLTNDETELSAALMFVVQGYFDRKDSGLVIPESIKETSNEFQNAINPLNSFVREEVVFDDGQKDGSAHAIVETTNAVLFQRFKDTASAELLKQVTNARSFSTHFAKIAPSYAKQEGVEIEKTRIGSMQARGWKNVRLVESAEDEKEDQTQNVKTDAKVLFGETTSCIEYVYKEINQTTDLRLSPKFPTYLVSGDTVGEAIKSNNGNHIEEEKNQTQTDANFVEFEHDLDEIIDEVEDYGGRT
jgi:phage/plasmid-associated DNA primase